MGDSRMRLMAEYLLDALVGIDIGSIGHQNAHYYIAESNITLVSVMYVSSYHQGDAN